MFNSLIERLLKQLLASFASEEKIREYAEILRRAAYRAIDVGIAALVTAILAYLNRPADDIILGASYYCLGDTPAQAVGSSVIVFVITSLFRYLGGWSFIIKILSSLFGVALVLLSVLMSLPLAVCVLVMMSVCWKSRGAEIVGPTQVYEHQIVELSAGVSDEDMYLWMVAPWDKTSAKYYGKKLVFTGPPGRYFVALSFKPPKGEQTQINTTVDILPASPSPTPTPTPTPPGPVPVPPQPTPAPVLPDGSFKFAAWAFNNAKPINDPAGAAALSGSIKGMLAAYAAGTLKASDLLPSLSSAIRERGLKWDQFRKDLAAELNRQGFRTRPPADWVVAGNELVTGLDAIK